MFGITKAATLSREAHRVVIREQSFIIPPAAENEKAEVYITALKANAPFEVCHLGGLNFEKSVLPDAATLPTNAGKPFFPKLLSKMMTKKQAEAIWAEAAKREIHVPRIHNPNYNVDSKNDDEPSTIEGGYFKISDWLILEPEASFDPRKYPTADTPWTHPASPVVTVEDVQTKLIEEQRQGSLIPKGKK